MIREYLKRQGRSGEDQSISLSDWRAIMELVSQEYSHPMAPLMWSAFVMGFCVRDPEVGRQDEQEFSEQEIALIDDGFKAYMSGAFGPPTPATKKDIFGDPGAVTMNILRRPDVWTREVIERVAKHLLGDHYQQ